LGRLIELDDVDAVRLQCARFLVEQAGESKRHFDAVAVKFVGDRIDDRHRTRHGDFEFLRMRARELRFGRVHAAFEAHLADDLEHALSRCYWLLKLIADRQITPTRRLIHMLWQP
jgi:hypothetical protein